MNYEKRFFEYLINTYSHIYSISREKAILEVKKMKSENPALYQKKLDEWFDMIHPY